MAILNRVERGEKLEKRRGETDSLVLRTPKIFRCTHRSPCNLRVDRPAPRPRDRRVPLGLINMSLSTLLGKKVIASLDHVLMACDFKGRALQYTAYRHSRLFAVLRICSCVIEGLIRHC